MSKKKPNPSSTAYYWECVAKVLGAAKRYTDASRIRASIIRDEGGDPDMAVLIHSFNGELPNLNRAIKAHEAEFGRSVKELNAVCVQNGIAVIAKPRKFLNELHDKKFLDFCMKSMRANAKQGRKVSLVAIERRYREQRTRRKMREE